MKEGTMARSPSGRRSTIYDIAAAAKASPSTVSLVLNGSWTRYRIKEETAKECISASLPWEDTEQVAWKVTEGPTVLHIGDTYYMFYSANDFRNIDYAVGIATADNPYGPWTKQNAPIISRTNIGYYGTGHGDAFLDDAGKWKYVFHTHQSFTKVAPRKTALVGLSFKNGSFTIEDNTFTYLYKK